MPALPQYPVLWNPLHWFPLCWIVWHPMGKQVLGSGTNCYSREAIDLAGALQVAECIMGQGLGTGEGEAQI